MKAETLEMMEDSLQRQIKKLNNAALNSKECKDMAQTVSILTDKLLNAEAQAKEIEANEQRLILEVRKLDIEEQKVIVQRERNAIDRDANEMQYRAALKQAKASWNLQRFASELLRTAGPIVAQYLILGVWQAAFENALSLEETGGATTTAFRMLKFPNIFK